MAAGAVGSFSVGEIVKSADHAYDLFIWIYLRSGLTTTAVQITASLQQLYRSVLVRTSMYEYSCTIPGGALQRAAKRRAAPPPQLAARAPRAAHSAAWPAAWEGCEGGLVATDLVLTLTLHCVCLRTVHAARVP